LLITERHLASVRSLSLQPFDWITQREMPFARVDASPLGFADEAISSPLAKCL
jgi:hypothetical protein